MSLSAEEITRVVDALSVDLDGAVVRKVVSPARERRVAMELRNAGANHWLQIVLQPQVTRLGRIQGKPRSTLHPHAFVMLLRKHLVGMRVTKIEQILKDRAVMIELQSGNRQWNLALELTSRHANLFLIDGNGKIVGSLFPNRSHKRQLVPGKTYVPPLPHPQSGSCINRFQQTTAVEVDIETLYRQRERSLAREARKTNLRRHLTGIKKHFERLLKGLGNDKSRAVKAEELATSGQLLKTYLHSVKKGMTSIDVFDFEGNPKTIALEPTLSPVDNMERFFNKARKLKGALTQIDERLEEATENLSWIKERLKGLETAEPNVLKEIEAALCEKFPKKVRRLKKGSSGPEERLSYREYVVAGGRIAKVGRSAKDNDTLTLRHTRPGDLWLHVRGRKGAHVSVPLGRNEEPNSELLVDAAHLAVHFSEAANDDNVEVIYTRRRYVQKPKGSAPGSVRVLKEKTVVLRKEPERLKTILKTER